jgi:hypothetical protein
MGGEPTCTGCLSHDDYAPIPVVRLPMTDRLKSTQSRQSAGYR